MSQGPVVLCILDGWGWSESADHNAIKKGQTPCYNQLLANYPHSLLATSGEAVGLSDGQMGNSEVGHMNIGSGRVVMQNLPRINHSIKTGEFANHKPLQAFSNVKRVHLMGLISDGGVHAHQDHVVETVKLLDTMGAEVCIHAFLDGRDTPPQSAHGYIQNLLEDIKPYNARLVSMAGRYYAMDRDMRWERVQKSYEAMVHAQAPTFEDPLQWIESAYANDQTDEFIEPAVVSSYEGMQDGDGLLMANFRADRAREILTSLVDPAFDGFERETPVEFSHVVGMVHYSNDLAPYVTPLFPPQELAGTLGEVVAHHKKKQLRIAETEKYAHVTFFFNGGKEEVYEGEDRILIPSPKVATYDLQPEMSAGEVTNRLVDAIESEAYDLIVVNYANPDMVGHTGVEAAAIKAVETIDQCLARLEKAVLSKHGDMLITADHGNVEMMKDQNGQPHTAHTTGPVPLILVSKRQGVTLKDGRLCDIAPTILLLMGVDQPSAMTGVSVIV